LDTCTFLWIVTDAPELSNTARTYFTNPDHECFLSSVSTWEMTVKHALGRLPLPNPPDQFIPTQRELHGITTLPLDEEATLYLSRLPSLHSDPFDRMLICQALAQGLILLTPDEEITRYPVRTIW
jgi:PIN domain nuclease of toxin-antitoxin system